MKIDKTKLLQDIEAIKAKLASMEEELNKTEVFKHFPSKGDTYHYYLSTGTLCDNTASNDDLKVNVFKTRNEAQKAYNKAVAIEKIKRRLLELQGDWKPDSEDGDEEKVYIMYDYNKKSFIPILWFTAQPDTSLPFMEDQLTAITVIKEMEDELKLIFDID